MLWCNRNAVAQASQLSRGIIPIKDLHDFQLLNNQLKTDDNISKALVREKTIFRFRYIFQAIFIVAVCAVVNIDDSILA